MSLRTLGDSGGIAAQSTAAPRAPTAESEDRLAPKHSLWTTFRERYTRARAGPKFPQMDDGAIASIGIEHKQLDPASIEC